MHRCCAAPWKAIGDGCKFVPLWDNLDRLAQDRSLSVHYERFEAPIMSFVKPHIKGSITKLLDGPGPSSIAADPSG